MPIVAISELTLSLRDDQPIDQADAAGEGERRQHAERQAVRELSTAMPMQPTKASDAPTDRSTSAVMISMVMPEATISTSAHWRRMAMMLASE